MNSRTSTYLLVPWLVLSACDCQDHRTPARSAQGVVAEVASTSHEGPAPVMAPPEGTPLASNRLQPYATDVLAGYAASGAAELRSSPLPNGGQVPAVRRTYERGPQKLQLEINDSLHTPAIRQLITNQQGQARKTPEMDYRGTEVNGHPAIVQWSSTTQTAMVNVLIANRFLASVKVSPVETAEPAVEVANALPVAEIAKLAQPIAPPGKPGTEDAPAKPGDVAQHEAATPAAPAQPAAR
jgi:hypothetical protein